MSHSGFCGKFLEPKRITRVNTGGQWTKISTIWDLQVATCYPNTSMSIKSLTCRSRSIDIAANLTVNLVDSETSEQANTVGLFSPLQTLLKIEMTNLYVNASEKLIGWILTLTYIFFNAPENVRLRTNLCTWKHLQIACVTDITSKERFSWF